MLFLLYWSMTAFSLPQTCFTSVCCLDCDLDCDVWFNKSISATVLSMWLIYQVWGDLTEQNTTQGKKNKIKKKNLQIFIKRRGKKCNILCIVFAWQLQLSQTQHDELFHIPSLPRDVVDLTSRDPFLMSLCLQVWVSVKEMILHNDTKFCLRCVLKELKLRKAWQQLNDIDLNTSADDSWSKCLLKLLPCYTVLNPVKFYGRTCLNVCAEGNSGEGKAPLLPLRHNCSCEHNLWSTPEFTQVPTATRDRWAKAEHVPANEAVHPRFLMDPKIQPVLRLQLTSTYSLDAKHVLIEVLICGMRVNGGVGHPHFHPHANSPQCSSEQCRHRCHELQSSHSNTMTQQHPSHFWFCHRDPSTTTELWHWILQYHHTNLGPCDSVFKGGLLYVTSKISVAGRGGACIFFCETVCSV